MQEEKRVSDRRDDADRRREDRRNTYLHVENNQRTIFRRREASRRDSANDKRVDALEMCVKPIRKTPSNI